MDRARRAVLSPVLAPSPALNEAYNGTWQRALNPTLSDIHTAAPGLVLTPLVRGEPPLLGNHNSTSGSQIAAAVREGPKDSGPVSSAG